MVYVVLAALLLQSFYSIDEFSGVVVREFALKTYAELLIPSNYDVILRTVAMAAAVTVASVVLAFPVAFFAARYARGRWKAVFYLGIMLPLWSSYLVKVYAWKLILAKEDHHLGGRGSARAASERGAGHPGDRRKFPFPPPISAPSLSSSMSGCPT